MNGDWKDVTTNVTAGSPFRYWSKRDGISDDEFVVARIDTKAIHIKIPSGNPVYIHRGDFENVYQEYDNYISGVTSRSEITNKSRRSAYIITLIHALRNDIHSSPINFGQLITPGAKLFLKPEFGPISEDWPGISFTYKSYADQLFAEMDAAHDFVIFSGITGSGIFDPKLKGRLLCVARIGNTGPLDSRLVIPQTYLERFQTENTRKFGWSIQVKEAWTFLETPKALDLIPTSYGQLKKHRGSFVKVDPTEVSALHILQVEPISLFTISLTDIAQEDLSDPLTWALSRALAGIRNRVLQGGNKQMRIAPPRKVSLSLDDLQQMWERSSGHCGLCGNPIPLRTDNPLLKLSPDRISSADIDYSLSNTQLTHLGCNLGKNSASIEHFGEWLSLLRKYTII